MFHTSLLSLKHMLQIPYLNNSQNFLLRKPSA